MQFHHYFSHAMGNTFIEYDDNDDDDEDQEEDEDEYYDEEEEDDEDYGMEEEAAEHGGQNEVGSAWKKSDRTGVTFQNNREENENDDEESEWEDMDTVDEGEADDGQTAEGTTASAGGGLDLWSFKPRASSWTSGPARTESSSSASVQARRVDLSRLQPTTILDYEEDVDDEDDEVSLDNSDL